MTALIDMSGKRFGRLVATERADAKRWLCVCDCGSRKIIAGRHLRSGSISSCGCYRRERGQVRGQANRRETTSYVGAHKRMHNALGKASDRTCQCGQTAAQWSYDHSDPEPLTDVVNGFLVRYSLDMARYRALCVPCHVRFDREEVTLR